MLKRILYLIIPFVGFTAGFSQEATRFGIDFSGFVKTDILYDSRQTVSLREGHFLLYPAPVKKDASGKDINASSNFNMLSIQTRLLGKISGPDALGAKTSGLIEGEFFGTSDADVNGFRLRHAYVKLKWENAQLLVGQHWHPLFITTSFPEVVSFNTGAPFQPFTRNPQISYTHQFGVAGVTLTAFSQRDFVSTGPDGPSSKYLRNAGIPGINLKFDLTSSDPQNDISYQTGVGFNYQLLKPRLETQDKTRATETFPAYIGMIYGKIKTTPITTKAMFLIGEDTYNLTMIGGYAVKDLSTSSEEDKYLPLTTASAWAEVMTNGKQWQAGLFAGYTRMLGAKEKIKDSYARENNRIDYIYRVSPRVIYQEGKFRISPELEYTVAAFGNPDQYGKIKDSREVGNWRFLVGVYYFF